MPGVKAPQNQPPPCQSKAPDLSGISSKFQAIVRAGRENYRCVRLAAGSRDAGRPPFRYAEVVVPHSFIQVLLRLLLFAALEQECDIIEPPLEKLWAEGFLPITVMVLFKWLVLGRADCLPAYIQ